MKSYTTLRNDYGKATLDTSATNLTAGDGLINDEIRRVATMADYPFMHKDRTVTTVADQQAYALPYDLESVSTVKVVVGTTVYSPTPINSQRQWDILNYGTYTSDATENYFVKDGEISYWPIPATSSTTTTLNGKLKLRDLNTADNTSQTITTLAAGGTALTVDAGLTVQMVGFWIRPTFSTTANTGDGQWYELSAVGSSTTATLARSYGGLAIAAGTAASTIAQMPILPDPFQDIPVFRAAEQYWAVKGNVQKALFFGTKAQNKMAEFNETYKTNINDPVIDNGFRHDYGYGDFYSPNPNLYPTGLSG